MVIDRIAVIPERRRKGMSRKIYDLTIPAGSYTDKNGKTRTNWENVGAVFQREDGKSFITLKRTFNPAGVPMDEKGSNRDSIIINLKKDEA